MGTSEGSTVEIEQVLASPAILSTLALAETAG